MAEQIKVGVDTGDSLKQLQDMAQAVNEFTQEVSKATGKQVRLLDASQDIAELKELLKNWQEVINAAPTLRGAITTANTAAGRPSGGRPITPMQLDQSLRQNQQWNHAAMVRLMTHNASHSAAPANTGLAYHDYTGRFQDAPPPPAPVNRPKQNDARFSKIAQSAMQGLGSGGMAGGAIASFAKGAQRAGDTGLGAMGILKGGGVAALAYGAFQAVSAGAGAVSDKMDAGKQENIEIDKFKRSLGTTSDSLSQLKNQSRAVGEQFNLTYEQSRKLTIDFANTAKTNAPGQAAVGVDLAQATGADESQGVGYMATMRKSGSLGEKTADARLLSIQFAEALKRTGSTMNAGELMHAISGFASTTAQRSLGAPNTEGYAGMLSAMLGSGAPGLKGNVGNAAAILNHADAAFQGGGAMGEASKTLQYMALDGDKVGLLGVKMRQAAGMFATGADVFGNGKGAVNTFLGKNNMTRFGGRKSGVEQVLEKFANSGMSKEAQLLAAGNHFQNMNPEQMATLMNLRESGHLTGMTDLMKQNPSLKGKFDTMSGAGYVALSEVQDAGTDTDKLSALRGQFGTREGLTTEQKSSLSGMDGLKGKSLQDALVNFTTTLEREKTLGEQAQETAAKMANDTSRMADNLIPLAQDSKKLLSDLLSWMAPDSPQGKARKEAEDEAKKQAGRDAFGVDPAAMTKRNGYYDQQREKARSLPEGWAMQDLDRINAQQKDEMGSYAGRSIRGGMANDPRRLDAGSNNFGNLRSAQNGSFGAYATPEEGIAATDANLRAYGKKHGINTLGGVIRRWAPPNENNTNAYIANASKWTGINPNSMIDLSNPAVRKKISYAIFKQEGRMPKDQLEQFRGAQIPAGNPAGNATATQSPSPTSMSGTATVVVRVESANGLKAQVQEIPSSVVLKPKPSGSQPWKSLVQ